MGSTLNQDDFHLFIQPAQARRAGRPSRYSSNDDDFHDMASLNWFMLHEIFY
jgi:hypothetical protein